MVRPGVNFETVIGSPGRAFPSDTGTGFVVGLAERGPTDRAVLVHSLAEFITHFGARVSYGYLYDAAEIFFQLGGRDLWVARVVGPLAVKDTLVLLDADDDDAISVSTVGAGAVPWKIAVSAGGAGGTFVLTLSDGSGNTLQESPDLADNDAAVDWASTSPYIRVVKIGSVDPDVIAATNLATGDDTRAGITATERQAAIDLFGTDLGAGQVYYPGGTTTAIQSMLLNHAEDTGRFALLDGTDTGTKATLVAQIAAQRAAANVNVTNGQIFGPWVKWSGVTRNTTRTVPPSIVLAGLYAASDGQFGNPNLAVAGENGEIVDALDLTYDLSDDLEELNDGGFTVIKKVYGVIRVYGARTLADPDSTDLLEADWTDAPAVRLRMAIRQRALTGGEAFAFDQINPAKLSEWHNFVTGILEDYRLLGALFGDSTHAYSVDTVSVNTADTIEDRQLNAKCGISPSPFVEQINFTISRTPVSA